MFKSKSEIVETVYNALPFATHINELDLEKENAIQFRWRSTLFRVSESGHVNEVKGHILSGSNEAILVQELIKKVYYGK